MHWKEIKISLLWVTLDKKWTWNTNTWATPNFGCNAPAHSLTYPLKVARCTKKITKIFPNLISLKGVLAVGILTVEKYPDMFLLITNPTLLTATLSRLWQCLATMGLGKLLLIVQSFQVVFDMLAFSQCIVAKWMFVLILKRCMCFLCILQTTGRFVEQIVMLSLSFRCNQIYKCQRYDYFGHTLLCYLSPTQVQLPHLS